MRSKEYTEIAKGVVEELAEISGGVPLRFATLRRLVQESSKCLELNNLYKQNLESQARFTSRTITPNFWSYHDRFLKILIAGGMYPLAEERGMYFIKIIF